MPPASQEVAGKVWPEAKTLDEYRMTRKAPYAFAYFNVGEDVQKIPSFQNWAVGIDDFVHLEIVNNKLEDSLDTYHNVLSSIIKGMSINKDTVGSVKMEKLYRWINEVIRPQKEIEYRKKRILGLYE